MFISEWAMKLRDSLVDFLKKLSSLRKFLKGKPGEFPFALSPFFPWVQQRLPSCSYSNLCSNYEYNALNDCVLQNSSFKILTLDLMVLRGGTFRGVIKL